MNNIKKQKMPMTDFIEDAIAKAKVKLDCSAIHENLYSATITSAHGKLVREIAMKPGYEVPSLGNIIYHYAMNAQQISQYDDILEWANDRKHDLNDPEIITLFNQLVNDQRDIRLLLSEPLYVELIAALEISQAIENARPR